MKTKCLLMVVAALVVAGASCRAKKAPEQLQTSEWEEFRFREVRAPRSRSCNFVVSTPALSEGQAEVRLLFALQGAGEGSYENYYFVGVTRGRLTLGRAECGIEVPLAHWPEAGPGEEPTFSVEQRVTVMFRPSEISVAVGNRRVVTVTDDTFPGDRAAIGVRGLPRSVRPTVLVERTGEVCAADDFMRMRGEEAAWRPVSGQWAVESVSNPALSANAFVYAGRPGTAEPGVALLGDVWWDDYTFGVSAKPVGNGGFGVVFRYVDGANYYLFRDAEGQSGRCLQLVRVIGGRETILASRPAALMTRQWYRVGVTACGSLLRGYVDGNLAFSVRDDGLAFGRVGLYVSNRSGAEFDDVLVEAEHGIVENFGSGRLAWYVKGGRWSVPKTDGSPRLRAVGPVEPSALRAGKLLGGERTWADYRVSAKVARGSRGAAGIIVRYRDELAYDEFTYDIDGGKYLLALVRGGERRVVGQAAAPSLDASRRLSLSVSAGALVCKVDGEQVLSHFDRAIRSGKAGLCVGRASDVSFEDLSVEFTPGSTRVLTRLDTFARETTMKSWAAVESDWRKQSTDVFGETRQVNWHRAAFPGKRGIRVGGFFSSMRGGTLRLFTGCDLTSSSRGGRVKSGYELVVRSPEPGAKKGEIELRKNGRPVASCKIATPRGECRVTMREIEDHIVAEMDGKAVLAFRAGSPLKGWKIGYAVEDVAVKVEDVHVFGENTIAYAFVKAVSDWRTAGGEWLVTNRWRCDPRWSFFGGDSVDGVAAVWNKRRFEGDMSVEYAVGIRHQPARGGSTYRYASNMNAVICGDGASLKSGYGFVYGGWSNTKTAITRNGKVVAECTSIIPIAGMHRRWFYLRVVKREGNLKLYVDNALVLEYTDPDPLPGGQIALWTWQNGLMVGRVRVAAERIGAREHFTGVFPQVSRTLYDN